MHTKWHILFGFVFSFLIALLFNFSMIEAIVIFLSSVLIDIDHFLRFVFLKKSINPVRFWNWSIEKSKKYRLLSYDEKIKYKLPIFIFHGIEFWLLIAILAFFNKIFLLVLIGIAIHLPLDFYEIIKTKCPAYAKLSQIYLVITNRKKKAFD